MTLFRLQVVKRSRWLFFAANFSVPQHLGIEALKIVVLKMKQDFQVLVQVF